MRVMITGASGQLGRALVKSALPDAELRALSHADLDITDEAAVATAVTSFRPQLLFNTAAYTAVDRAETDIGAAYRLNRDAPGFLARTAAACNARFVHISTDYVFDGHKGTPYLPNDETSPLNVYGASKLAGEAEVLKAAADALIVRTAWVHAAGGQNFVRTMLRLMTDRPEIRVVADQIGTPTHANSLARALWSLVRLGATGTHHYTDAGVASWYDFAVAIQEEACALGLLTRRIPVVPVRTSDFPAVARRPAYSVLDKTESWGVLGNPAAHWRAELRLMLSEMRDRADA